MPKMTTKQKLLKLADFLEHKVKSPWFDMETWADRGFPEKKCGTTACAVGWATVCFPRSGLTLMKDDCEDSCDDDDLEIVYKRPGHDTLSNFEACTAFFDIDHGTADYLFAPDEYPKRRQGRMSVVRRLRAFVNKMTLITDRGKLK